MFGYMGKILRVDLSEQTVIVEKVSQELVKKYIGGSGLAAKYLYDETNAETNPLGPENLLIFMTGPFCGTFVPTSGRHAVVTKSPLTGIFAESDVGGTWGYVFKSTGNDGLIIKGRADKPAYLYLDEDLVEIRDASALWGKDTFATYDALKSKYGKKAEVTCIGQAGENLVKYAAIMTDGEDGRAAGRCGTGAVMGAKNLKAIVVKGTKRTEIFNETALRSSIKNAAPNVIEATAAMKKYGTSGGVIGHESYGSFPLKNWLLGRWQEGVEKISGQWMTETILTGVYHCKTCIIGCGRKIKITDGPYKGVSGAGPEYETLGTLGGMCLIDDLEALAYGSSLCNRYGLDTISTGAAIAFAMEAFEKNLITVQDTDGIKLKFGNTDAMLMMIEKIAKREGFGKVLAEGVKNAAEIIGKGTSEFAIHVKGLEPPAHDPRALHGVALSYATSNRGACHLAGFTHPFERVRCIPEIGYPEPHDRHRLEGKGKFVADLQNLMGVYDSIKLCKFIINGLSLTDFTDWINYVTGWEVSIGDVMEIGERIYNLKRQYNVKQGISRKDDTLPVRFLKEERTGQDLVVSLPDIATMLRDYYDYRGWDEDGIPLKAKLRQLGLDS
jgi:aldehyde:ferredoxin oxidoreductase